MLRTILSFFSSTGFHIADYVIFAGVLVVSTSIGLYHAFTGGKQRTTKEYFMANRKLSTLPVAASILVSFISAITVLGTPAEMYTRGTQMFMRTIGYCLSLLVSSLMFVPLFFPLKITSSFEVILLCFFLSSANEVWGKVTFLHLSVILFTGGVYPSMQWGTHPGPPRANTHIPWTDTPLGADTPLPSPPPPRLRDKVNKRAVRILLECILVLKKRTQRS